eukprot:gene14356-16940_t
MLDSWLAVGLVLVSGILAYSWKRPHPAGQTVEVGEASPNEGRARRNALSPNHLVSGLESEGIRTLYDSLMRSAEKYKNKDCFGYRKTGKNGELADNFEFITYGEYIKRCEALFQGLCELGITPKSKIGIFSRNRLEWLICQGACFMQSNIIVSFYETLGVDSLAFVSKHAEIHIAFCSQDTLDKTREIATTVKELTTIVCFDDVEDKVKEEFKAIGIALYSLNDLYEMGKDAQHKHTPPLPNDLCTIMYTSGTTGDPKGVMITHRNVMSVVVSVNALADVYEDDTHYSYLPYAHILERVVVATAYHYGAAVGIFCGDTTKILTEVKSLKPTLFIGVPRVFERIKAGVFREIGKKTPVQQAIFNAAYKLKHVAVINGFKLPIIESLLNLIVFNKLKAQLGGRVRVILSGSAPLSLDTEAFLKVCFSCSIVQGYGLTETCGGTAVKLLTDDSLGSLGPPFVACEIKLVDCPELNYSSSNSMPTGEVCIRGPSVAIGYYKDDAKTKQDFKDGWFSTGDIGRWNPDGSLSIIDRKKNIFKLSQGEYIAVEKIEGIIGKSQLVAQVCVYGESQKSCVIAIIHPHQDKAEEWAKSNNVNGSFKEICENKEFNTYLLNDITSVSKKSKLYGFEIPKKIHLIHDPFTDQNNMMTPSFKLKRPQIKEYYADILKELYNLNRNQIALVLNIELLNRCFLVPSLRRRLNFDIEKSLLVKVVLK